MNHLRAGMLVKNYTIITVFLRYTRKVFPPGFSGDVFLKIVREEQCVDRLNILFNVRGTIFYFLSTFLTDVLRLT